MLRETPQGLAVDKFARDGSGLISGLRAADGLIDIPEDVAEVKPGDPVAFIPFARVRDRGAIEATSVTPPRARARSRARSLPAPRRLAA